AVAVAVGGDAADLLAGRVDGPAAPGVAGRAADADLHRPGRAEGVGATVHAGQLGAAVVALDLADAGQDHPRHAVLGAGRLEQREVAGGDGVLRVMARAGLGSAAVRGAAGG